MKKKLIAASAMTIAMLGVSLCVVSANATTEDIVTKDQFVFNGNNLTSGYVAGANIANKNDVNVKLGNNYSGSLLTGDLVFGDYGFEKGLLAVKNNTVDEYSLWSLILGYLGKKPKNQDVAQYYISAKEGMKCGFYYTVVDKNPIETVDENGNSSYTYYISSKNTIKFIKEGNNKKTTVLDTVTEKLSTMYYSEFTFGSQSTIGMTSDTQYILLFGVSIVTVEEQENRVESNAAIDALINYYNTNGVSTSYVFEELVNNAKAAIADVNHVSQIPNYDLYKDILVKYDELVKVENKIDTLNNPYARSFVPNVRYDAESKALLDDIAAEIEYANSLGIENSNVSNYDLYVTALNYYNELEADNLRAQNVVELINNLGEVEYSEAYKNQLALIDEALNEVNDQSLISNLDEFLNKKAEFEALSNSNISAFISKVNEANASKGEASSYILINEANELFEALIESDKNNEEVLAAKELLEEVQNSYNDYQAEITNNDFAFSYNADGTVKSIFFIGTINDYTCCEELSKITISYTNESTKETTEIHITTVYSAIKISGSYVKTEADGVRYVYTKLVNTDNQYAGVEFTMTYTVEYKDGHVVTSESSTIEVK